MDAITRFFREMLYSIPTIGVTDILDILVVTILIYKLLSTIRSTSAARVGRAILLLLLITGLTEVFNMYALNWILSKVLEMGVIALVIVFQPELRRTLERVGDRTLNFSLQPTNHSDVEKAISATVSACEVMSRERIGVLLVFERTTLLDEYIKKGTPIDAQVTEQLLRNLFFPNTALHDGAVIVRNGRIAAAGCVMPLSENPHLSSDLGTRHRAGIGTSEESDAVVVIVSEETGIISVASGGMLKRHLAPQTLEKLLMNELLPGDEQKEKNIAGWLKSQVTKRTDWHEE